MEEIKELNVLSKRYKEQGLSIVMIAIDDPKTASKVKPFMTSHGYSFTTAIDANRAVSKKYHISSVPQSFLVDGNGIIRLANSGYVKGDEKVLEEKIKEVIGNTLKNNK